MYSLHYSLPLLGVALLAVFLAWHYRHLYVDRLPRSVSSRLRYYAPLTTFEDAAEQGAPLRPPCLSLSFPFATAQLTPSPSFARHRLLDLALRPVGQPRRRLARRSRRAHPHRRAPHHGARERRLRRGEGHPHDAHLPQERCAAPSSLALGWASVRRSTGSDRADLRLGALLAGVDANGFPIGTSSLPLFFGASPSSSLTSSLCTCRPQGHHLPLLISDSTASLPSSRRACCSLALSPSSPEISFAVALSRGSPQLLRSALASSGRYLDLAMVGARADAGALGPPVGLKLELLDLLMLQARRRSRASSKTQALTCSLLSSACAGRYVDGARAAMLVVGVAARAAVGPLRSLSSTRCRAGGRSPSSRRRSTACDAAYGSLQESQLERAKARDLSSCRRARAALVQAPFFSLALAPSSWVCSEDRERHVVAVADTAARRRSPACAASTARAASKCPPLRTAKLATRALVRLVPQRRSLAPSSSHVTSKSAGSSSLRSAPHRPTSSRSISSS